MADKLLNDWRAAFQGFDIIEEQVAALHRCVQNLTTVTTTAEQLAAHPEAAATPLDMQQRLGGLWTLLIDTAIKVPSTQPAVVSILLTLRARPSVKKPKGEGEEFIDLDDGHIWHEMTGWASNWADAFNGYGAQFIIEASSDQNQTAKHAEWTNACAFAARLDATGDEPLSSYGAGLDRASRAIADALESDNSDREPGSLAAAAQIFELDSRGVYQRCQANQATGMRNVRSNSLWKGNDGFSEARWRLWKERWTALKSSSSNCSVQAREMAEGAFAAMKQAEL